MPTPAFSGVRPIGRVAERSLGPISKGPVMLMGAFRAVSSLDVQAQLWRLAQPNYGLIHVPVQPLGRYCPRYPAIIGP
jgi:hypothetical protein